MSVAPVPILVLSGARRARLAGLGRGARRRRARRHGRRLARSARSRRRRGRRLPPAPEAAERHARDPPSSRRAGSARPRASTAPARPARAIGICSSTGGPQALLELLGSLPASFPLPILVAQHITTGFADGLARWLDASVALPVRIGARGRDARARASGSRPTTPTCCSTPSGRLALDRGTPAGHTGPRATCCSQSLAATRGRDAVSRRADRHGPRRRRGHGSRARGGRLHDRAGRGHARRSTGCRARRPSAASTAPAADGDRPELCSADAADGRAMSDARSTRSPTLIRARRGIRLEESQHQALRAALARAWPASRTPRLLRRALDPATGRPRSRR